jgi:hypothetical protein
MFEVLCMHGKNGTGKAIPLQALTGPEGSKRLRPSRCQENWHMKVVRLSARCTDSLYPPSIIPGTHFC